MSTKKDLTPVAKRRTKLIYEAFQEELDDRDMLFQSSVMAHCYLPRREPGLAPNEIWQAESGKFSLYYTLRYLTQLGYIRHLKPIID